MKKLMTAILALALCSATGFAEGFGDGQLIIDTGSITNGLSTMIYVDTQDAAGTNWVSGQNYRNGANQTNILWQETVSFISTNATYEVIWFGPWDYTLTLESMFAKVDGGTQGVYLVEQATNAAWRTFTTNNYAVATATSVRDTSWTDSSVAVGNLLGVNLGAYANSTQGFVTVIGKLR